MSKLQAPEFGAGPFGPYDRAKQIQGFNPDYYTYRPGISKVARRATTPIISKLLPVADADTGWKPMLQYTVAWSLCRAELPSGSISRDRSTLRRAMFSLEDVELLLARAAQL